VTDRLYLVKAGPLLVFGDADPISPVRVGEFLRDRIAGARLEVVPGGTHGMTTEVPDTVADLIRAYLRE
jgi:pimeloyl-ACP methyl ester carboxylesterase